MKDRNGDGMRWLLGWYSARPDASGRRSSTMVTSWRDFKKWPGEVFRRICNASPVRRRLHEARL